MPRFGGECCTLVLLLGVLGFGRTPEKSSVDTKFWDHARVHVWVTAVHMPRTIAIKQGSLRQLHSRSRDTTTLTSIRRLCCNGCSVQTGWIWDDSDNSTRAFQKRTSLFGLRLTLSLVPNLLSPCRCVVSQIPVNPLCNCLLLRGSERVLPLLLLRANCLHGPPLSCNQSQQPGLGCASGSNAAWPARDPKQHYILK